MYHCFSMLKTMPIPALSTWFIAALFISFGTTPVLQAQENQIQKHQETIAVLHMLYGSEIRATHRFELFSKTAQDEGNQNIAYMFKAIAASEAIHARNFKRILGSLGIAVAQIDLSSIKSTTTKENLKYASEIELAEIDVEYPRYIHRISPEAHQEALELVNYAWETERQHRELIKDIQSRTGMFFGVLLERFRNKVSKYYVCQHCGATITELPVDACPICYKPLEIYIEISIPRINKQTGNSSSI